MEGFMKIFDHHKIDLSQLYGEFPEYKSFEAIITIERNRWIETSTKQKRKLLQYIKK